MERKQEKNNSALKLKQNFEAQEINILCSENCYPETN